MSEITNKVISADYKLYRNNPEGELIESTEGKEPLQFMTGVGMMIPDFENELIDLNMGDEFSFGIKSDKAYGEVREDAVIDLPQDIFMQDGKMVEEIQPGNIIPLQDPNGQTIPGKVVTINEETVTMDMNHPLAGQDLHFSGTVTAVRPASAEELDHGHVH